MSNVASLVLCKELHDLSGWEAPDTWAFGDELNEPIVVSSDHGELGHDIYRVAYAYDLGYLLRKLPAQIEFNDEIVKLTLDRQSGKMWRASYAYPLERMKAKRRYADWKFLAYQYETPENALCRLAITLLKQGILGKQS